MDSLGLQEYIDRFPKTVSNQDLFGVSALHEAAGAGWVDPVKMLLTAGASPSIKDEDGRSPLYYAAKAGHMSIVTMLLKRGDNSGYPVEGTSMNHMAGTPSVAATTPIHLASFLIVKTNQTLQSLRWLSMTLLQLDMRTRSSNW